MVSQKKIQLAQEIRKILLENKVIGVANILNLPTKQFQLIRKKLKQEGVGVKVVKKSILRKVLESLVKEKKELEALKKFAKKGENISIALLYAKDYNPFKLYKIIEESKTPAPAKPGVISPKDIEIPEGPTPFSPGPMIGELSRLGLKVRVEGGKIYISQGKVVVRKGERISEKVAEILNKLGIEPLEIKLDVLGILHDKIFYPSDVLSIDYEEYKNNIKECIRNAIKLSLKVGLITKDNIEIAIRTSVLYGKRLSIVLGIPSKSNIRDLLSLGIRVAKRIEKDISKFNKS